MQSDVDPLLGSAVGRVRDILAAGDPVEAVAIARQILKIAPGHAPASQLLAVGLDLLGRTTEAEQVFNDLAGSGGASHWNALGCFYAKHGRDREAGDAFARANRLDPRNGDYWANVALNAARTGDPEAVYAAGLAATGDAKLWYDYGVYLADRGRVAEANRCYESAVRVNPGMAKAHYNLGLGRLALGDYARGFTDYEWRTPYFRSIGRTPRTFAVPAWRGEALEGKTLLLYCEQGGGDFVQFVRYAAVVKDLLGARVVVSCQDHLAPVLARAAGVDEAVGHSNGEPAGADYCCEVMSLPYWMGTTYETVPSAVPYIAPAPPARRGRRCRVGLAWAGSGRCPHDARRSMPLAALWPLVMEGVEFYSVHREPPNARATASNFPVKALPNEDFGLAAVATMDLVISVDTALAHLAGAVGKPVWVVLPDRPDWRWGLSGGTTPWYPTARLFRQEHAGDWGGVVGVVAEELEKVVDERSKT